MNDSTDSNEIERRDFWPKTAHGRWMDSGYQKGLVSVIVPAYNRAEMLPTALSSVWRQTYRPIELIVIDDGSDDDTPAVAEQWAAEHDGDSSFTVRVIRQENQGAGAARNRGLIASIGEFIQYLDSDDVLHPEKFERHVRALREMECEYVWSPMVEAPRTSIREEAASFPSDEKWSEVWFDNPERPHVPESACAGLYSRPLCVRVGPWAEDLVCREDWDYRYRCDIISPSRTYVAEPMYAALTHPDERVHDLFASKNGVGSLVRILERGEKYRREMQNGRQIVLKGWYLRAFKLALQHGTPGQARRIFELVQQSPETSNDRWKFLFILYKGLGRTMTRTLLTVYSYIRTI